MGARWTFGSRLPRAGSPALAAYFRSYYKMVLLIAPDNLLLYAPFDGDTEDASGNDNTPSTESGGIIYPSYLVAPNGGGCVQLAEATTNLIINPSFEVDLYGWHDQGTVTKTRDNERAYVGSYAMKCVAGANNTQYGAVIYNVVTGSPVAQDSYSLQARVYADANAAGTTAKIQINETGGASGDQETAAQEITLEEGWNYLSCSGTVNKTDRTSLYVIVRILDAGVVAGDTVWWDAIQMEKKSYLTPYCDGSLGDGHSWSGTAHNSTSSRTKTNLQYTLNLPDEFTISTWAIPMTLPSETTSYSRLWQWSADANNNVFLAYAESADKAYIAWRGDGSTSHIFDIDLNRFQPYHYVLTYDGTTAKLYRDGSSVDQVEPTAFAATPDVLYIGAEDTYNNLNGWLAHFAVWNKALDAAEVEYISAP